MVAIHVEKHIKVEAKKYKRSMHSVDVLKQIRVDRWIAVLWNENKKVTLLIKLGSSVTYRGVSGPEY